MKVMVIVKATQDSEAGVMPSEKLLTDMGRFNEELAEAGIMLAGEGLHPSSKGARVRFAGTDRTVIDGPFVETKELVAGYWLWKVDSLEDAVEWVKRCPNPHEEECEIEIRPVFEADDFGDAFTPELREQEAAVRAQALGLGMPRFEEGREMLIAGLNGSYTPATRSEIPAQWERFGPHIGKVAGQIGGASYGVAWNCTADGRFDYLTGVVVEGEAGLPSEFTHVRIPARRYAVFTHAAPISSFGNTIDAIWRDWAPESGLKMDDSPCIERYTEEFDPETGGAEICVPLAS